MADDIDIANERAQISLEVAITIARGSGNYLIPNGLCHNCGERVAIGLNFCDVNCRDDFQSRNPEA